MYKFTFVLLLFLHTTTEQDFSPIADLKTLSELPLEKLLEVKNTLYTNDVNSLNYNSNYEVDNEVTSQDTTEVNTQATVTRFTEVGPDEKSRAIPEPQAVRAKRKGLRRGEYSHEVYHKKDKKGIQSLFQLSVTTLAFLAFGGYLVCLLVQAFKSKQGMMGGMMPTSPTGTGPALLVVRKGKPKRRKPLRNKGAQPRQRRDADDAWDEGDAEPWSEADPEAMYQALTMLAEGYTAYQIRDYKYYNGTTFGGSNRFY